MSRWGNHVEPHLRKGRKLDWLETGDFQVCYQMHCKSTPQVNHWGQVKNGPGGCALAAQLLEHIHLQVPEQLSHMQGFSADFRGHKAHKQQLPLIHHMSLSSSMEWLAPGVEVEGTLLVRSQRSCTNS